MYQVSADESARSILRARRKYEEIFTTAMNRQARAEKRADEAEQRAEEVEARAEAKLADAEKRHASEIADAEKRHASEIAEKDREIERLRKQLEAKQKT